MTDQAARSEYFPKKTRMGWYGLIMLVCGGFMAVAEWPKPVSPAAAGQPVGDLATDISAGVLIIMSLPLVVLWIRRLPRLTLDGDVLSLQTLFRTVSVRRDQLGPFTPGSQFIGKREVATATAMTSGGPKPKRMVISDVFETPLPDILAAISAWQGHAVNAALRIEPVAVRPMGDPRYRGAWLTWLMLAIFGAVFVIEQMAAVAPADRWATPSVVTLDVLGALSWAQVAAGDWFRLFTAPFLHAGPVHLLFNAIAFALAGPALERYLGWAWTLCVFALGALAGSALSLVTTAQTMVSVGASGGIMAMLATLLVISIRLPTGRQKQSLQMRMAQMAVPAVIPLGGHAGVGLVDYGAHIGGAMFGVVVGVMLLRTWRPDAALPRFRSVAAVLACVLVVMFSGAGAMAARSYRVEADRVAALIPADLIPKDDASVMAQGEDMLARYPGDGRSYWMAGVVRLRRNDVAGAEGLLRKGLTMVQADPANYQPVLASNMQALLALMMVDQGRSSDAIAFARPACAATGVSEPGPNFKKGLVENKLCEGAAK